MEIIKKQKDFFLYGHDHLKAMKLDDIAKKLDINISTISRIAQKYILVNGSILQIKKLFS